MRRRAFLLGAAALAAARGAGAAAVSYPVVRPGVRLEFPRDHGAHPEFRQEWWYVTGWLSGRRGEPLGFQVTFFRARPDIETQNPSALTPRQVILAHAAISDPQHGALRHDERAARAALGLAGAEEGATRVWVDDWRLELERDTYRSRIAARGFALDLEFQARQPPLAQGEHGFSRKGEGPDEASYYYSRPHLEVRGTVERGGVREAVTGSAWLDHEWSSRYLSAEASGWDWVGLNLAGGESMMAFRMRDKSGRTLYAPPGVAFEPLRTWRSPRTGVEYPIAMRVS
ncbi:MAG TPA: carotenoid 1,2-hydratase, partial [Burkholderiales bacterium]|nr:carotenoid 1,2-hydratase [Burkholderiales bacterium]